MMLNEVRVACLLKLGVVFLVCAVRKSGSQTVNRECQGRCDSEKRFYQGLGLSWQKQYQQCLVACVQAAPPLPFGVIRPQQEAITTAAATTHTTTTPTSTTTTTPTTTTTTSTTTTITTTPTTTTTSTTTTTTPTTTTTTPTTTTTIPTTTSTTLRTTTTTSTTTTTTPTTTTTTATTTTPTTTTTSTTTSSTTTTTSTTTPTTPTTTTSMTTSATITDAVCGKQNGGLHQHRERVVGGFTADECEYPWMALIVIINNICGGSLVGNRFVMTAAHCVRNRMTGEVVKAADIRVKLASSSAALTTEFRVANVTIHPSHDMVNKINDIAVLTLVKVVDYSSCIRPICLPAEWSDPREADVCVVAGWGVTDVSAPNSIPYLQEVQLPLVNQELCQLRYGSAKVNEQTFCAGDYYRGGADSCQGDSGSPLMCQVDGRFVAQGIVSNGFGCALATYPGIYTRVSHPNNLRFLKSVLGVS